MVQVTYQGSAPLPTEGGDTWLPGEERLLTPDAALRLVTSYPGRFKAEPVLQSSLSPSFQVR